MLSIRSLRPLFRAVLLLLAVLLPPAAAVASPPDWVGNGAYRLLVEVAPIDIGGRAWDARPASLALDFQPLLNAHLGIKAIGDLRSVQVVRYDPVSGAAYEDGDWAYGGTPGDRAFRWYDDAIPNPYPEVESYLSNTLNGTPTVTNRENWGAFLDVEGDWQSGRLAWDHTQHGSAPSYYAIYFDVLPTVFVPHLPSPRGFLGDGGMRTQRNGVTTTGAIGTRIDVTDWNGDGLPDIVAGNQRGAVSVYHNLGTVTQPKYGASKLVSTTDGRPIDIGWNSAPVVFDFDGDGIDDIVTGGQHNRIAWYKNIGDNSDRQFVFMGNVRDSSGQVLALPTTPNPERPTITADYYPVLDWVDFSGNGEFDLVAGGYITGRLYHYKRIGVNSDGTPRLELQGPLQANGVPIDTEWGAAPTFADFNGNGLPDIVTGTFAINSGVTSDKFLQYYANVGAPGAPQYERRTFPRAGAFPAAALATPRAADFNGDGLLDLIVSSDTQIYAYRNLGLAGVPVWDVRSPALPGEWGSSPIFASQFVDWNGDGNLDKVQDLAVSLNLAQGNPGLYGSPVSVLPAGQLIPPKPGGGDGWQWLRLFDLDWDGELDIIDADHDGKIWLHRNLGTTSAPNFDTVGTPFMQIDGVPIDIGPGPTDPSFDQLQGSRATYSIADFNKNGRPDLVTVNFAGRVEYFENEMASQLDAPLFTTQKLVANLTTRGVPFAADFDGDGWLDILASSDPSRMLFVKNLGTDIGGRSVFAPGVRIDLIDAPYGSAGLNVVDFNGDGDADILIDTTHRYTVFTDGSFLQHGYAETLVLGVESRSLDGDYNRDGVVDAADYSVWRDSLGATVPSGTGADGDRDGVVGPNDYGLWKSNYGAESLLPPNATANVPEPSALVLLFVAAGLLTGARRSVVQSAS